MTLIRGAGHDERLGWVVPPNYNVVADVVDVHHRDAPCMVCVDSNGHTHHTDWGQLQDDSCRVARLLTERGVGRGGVVAVVMPQTAEAAAACVGVLRSGAALLCMSMRWSAKELEARLRAVRCRTVVVDSRRSELSGTREDVEVIALDRSLLAKTSPAHLLVDVSPDDPAHVYFTSGTTGPAKALVHAQRNVLGHNEFEVCHGLRPGDVFYGAGEWAWSHPKLLGPWRHGAVQLAVDSPRLDPNVLFRAISRAGVTSALLNPSMLKAVRAKLSPEVAGLPWSLRTVCSSNEPIPADLAEWFEATFGCPVREYYGLTESYPMLGYRAGEPVRSGSTGRPLPGWEVALLGRGDELVGADDVGEACLRARSNPQYPLGYLVQGRLETSRFGADWFRTGDTFRRDRQGYWYFVGRNDDVIKSSGYRIGPYEVEEVLESHPAVAAAAVVGAPDEQRGQIIRAFVVPSKPVRKDRTEALAADLKSLVKRTHSVFAQPHEVVFVSDLPTSSTGKIQRAALRRVGNTEE